MESQFYEKHQRGLFEYEVSTGETSQIVSAFGGHSQACGFTLHKDDVSEFVSMIKQEAELLTEDQFEYHYDVIAHLDIRDIDISLLPV